MKEWLLKIIKLSELMIYGFDYYKGKIWEEKNYDNFREGE